MTEQPIRPVDEFMRRGGNRWDSEFAAHAAEQRRIENAIRGQGLGVPTRVATILADSAEEV